MAKSERVRVSFLSIIQLNFRGDKKKQFALSQRELQEASLKMGFELSVYPEMVVTEEDAQKAAAFIREEKTDFLLVQNTSFASGKLIQHFVNAAPHLGLWAVEEESHTGYLPQNSFCGINLNASILREYLDPTLKYKWFFGNLSNPLCGRRLAVTIQAISVLKRLRGSTVLHIGGTAPGFTDFYFDERKLMRKLGVRVVEIEYGDLKAKALSYCEEELEPCQKEMLCEAVTVSDFASTKITQNARVYRAVRDLMEQYHASATAMSCWPRFREDWSFTPCAAFGRLNQTGYITACEGDVLSAVSMMMLKYAADAEPILMDLVAFDPEDDSVLFWHCGVASATYAKGGKIGLDTHYNPGPCDPVKGWLQAGPVATMTFAEMEFTSMRLTKDCDAMLTFRGCMIDKAPVYHGSGGWASALSQDGAPIRALDLVSTIMASGYQHHYPLVRGNVEAILYETAAWAGIARMKQTVYRDYLQEI